ncbi:hypothetical protein [Desulfonema magnum]|uniref:Uncharacterized protein n=1 Tax=Desulfonema magnum TaxID=45655 RepID=A0A975BZQ7_9BACT|nr:hypothetical protein [Desulfonema magnum]QTA93937.1 Uncharacterized protein dnm_100450 [Desulfonema magnum]
MKKQSVYAMSCELIDIEEKVARLEQSGEEYPVKAWKQIIADLKKRIENAQNDNTPINQEYQQINVEYLILLAKDVGVFHSKEEPKDGRMAERELIRRIEKQEHRNLKGPAKIVSLDQSGNICFKSIPPSESYEGKYISFVLQS